MISRRFMFTAAFALLVGSAAHVIAQDRQNASSAQSAALETSQPSSSHGSSSASSNSVHSSVLDARAMRIEGEKRFHTNCGRCHLAPHKFPPRAMATIIRHMRVRAMITDEDMKYIFSYMTQ